MQCVFKIKNIKIEIFSTSQEGSNSDSVDGFWIIKKTYQARKTFIIVWDSVPKNDLRVLQKYEIKFYITFRGWKLWKDPLCGAWWNEC